MSILDQSEVDALVQSLIQQGDPGEANGEQEHKSRFIRLYNFRSPDKFAREQIRTLYMLHDDFARLATQNLSASLRTSVSVEVVHVEQSDYEEFLNRTADPAVICILSMPPLRGQSLLEFDPRLALMVIDRLFGGKGDPPPEVRPLTDIEKAAIKALFGGLMAELSTVWYGTTELHPVIESVHSNGFNVQTFSSKEVAATVRLSVTMGGIEGSMRFCLPYYSLEPVLPRLSARHWINRGAREDTGERVSEDIAKAISVRVAAELGTVDLTLEQLLHLEEGDVISLGTPYENPVRLLVEGQPKFLGSPGRKGQRIALTITGLQKEAGDQVG